MNSLFTQTKRLFSTKKNPVNVVVTGATGNIAYNLLFRVASGEMLGKDQPINLHMHDIEMFKDKMVGVEKEIYDCGFSTVNSVKICTNYADAFKDVRYALLVGSKPRGPGMERADLLKDNGKIFIDVGKALDQHASKDLKAVVVGNPCNTNALIALKQFNRLSSNSISAMSRLDHNRSLAQLQLRLQCSTTDIRNLGIFGNHSPTMYPYLDRATFKGSNLLKAVSDDAWIKGDFTSTIQKRGAEIIKWRGASSAASAGSSALDHIRDWNAGTDDWVSMCVHSKGNSYGVDEDLIFSFPVECKNGGYTVVQGLEINDYSRQMIKKTEDELKGERDVVQSLF